MWGRPETDTARLFESMVLQLMQCGVTWRVVFNKREHFRRAFADYDVKKVAAFSKRKVEALMAMPSGTIIRNRNKINAVVNNAKLIVAMDAEAGAGAGAGAGTGAGAGAGTPSFADFIWGYCPTNKRERLKVKKSPSGNHMRTNFNAKDYKNLTESDGVHPTKTVMALSGALKKRGFKFMGPTTTLSFMQAVGLVNHHGKTCFAFARNEAEFKARDLRRPRQA